MEDFVFFIFVYVCIGVIALQNIYAYSFRFDPDFGWKDALSVIFLWPRHAYLSIKELIKNL